MVNQRLGLTGKPLENLTEQFLELSRITETDLSTNIETVTRLFGDWGIATKDQSAKLDELFRASQKTGVPVDRLAQIITKFGGPLRQLGFSFEEAAAMAGKFEKEGVNTELVMGSMRIALGKMAREGEKPVETFRRIVKQIENAGDAGKANALALQLFGARAGPDMAAAIREGRFSIDDLVKTIKNGKDTIRAAGKDTQDFGEKWQMFKNRVLVALEPVAIRVFDFIGKAMDAISKVNLSKVVDWFKDLASTLSDTFGPAVEAIRDLWEEFGPILVDGVKKLTGAIAGFVEGAIDVLKGVIKFVKGIFSGDWSAAWEGVKQIFKGAWEAIKSIVTGLVNQIATAVKIALTALAGAISAIWEGIKAAASAAWNGIKSVVSGAVDAIVGLVKGIAGRVADFASTIWNGLKNAFSTAWDAIKGVVDAAIDAIIGFIRGIPGRIADFAGSIFDAIKDAFNAVRATVRNGVDAIVRFITQLPGRIWKAAAGMFNGIKDAFLGVYNWIKARFNDIFGWMNDGDREMNKLIAKARLLAAEIGKGVGKIVGGGVTPPPVVQPNPDQQDFRWPTTSRFVSSVTSGGMTPMAFNPAITVFLGDREITDIVRVEIDGINTLTAQAVDGGLA